MAAKPPGKKYLQEESQFFSKVNPKIPLVKKNLMMLFCSGQLGRWKWLWGLVGSPRELKHFPTD